MASEREALLGVMGGIQSDGFDLEASGRANMRNDFQRDSRTAWILDPGEFSEDEFGVTEEIDTKMVYVDHPNFKKTKFCSCDIPFLQFSYFFWFFCFLVISSNIVVALILIVDNQINISGGTLQQWLIIGDSAVLILAIIWFIFKLLDYIFENIVECFSNSFIELVYLRWCIYQTSCIGVLWGVCCSISWKYFDNHTSVDISDQMAQKMHDFTIATMILFALIGLKIYIISTYEGYLYKEIQHLIGISLREERDIVRAEEKIIKIPDERLIAKKFRELDLNFYMSSSPFHYESRTKEFEDKTDHVSTHIAAATFADALLKQGSGGIFIKLPDFLALGKPSRSKYLTQLFRYLDKDGDGKVSSVDINIAIRELFQIRKELRDKMKSRRVLLEVSNTIFNAILFGAMILVVLVYIFELNLEAYAVPFATLILALSFAYQNMLSDIVDNVYTLFFIRPFNIGDLIEVDGERYYIEKVGLLSSECMHEDGYISYISNSFMRKQPLDNWNRGRWVLLKLTCLILPNTTIQQLDEFKQQFTYFCAHNPQIYSTNLRVYTDSDMNPGPTLVIKVKLKGVARWQDKKRWQAAQTKALAAIGNIAEGLGILDRRNYLRVMKGQQELEKEKLI